LSKSRYATLLHARLAAGEIAIGQPHHQSSVIQKDERKTRTVFKVFRRPL
jgi:hypothetical protein